MQKKLDKSSVFFIVIVAILGLLTIVRTAVTAVLYFNLPLFIIHVMEVLCFVWALYYALCNKAKSSKFFKSTIIMLAATFAMTASLDPELTFLPHTYANPLLSFVAVAGLTVILCKWEDFALCKVVSWVVILASIAIAVIVTLLPLETADPTDIKEPVLQIMAAVYTRPLLTICILGSYMARMSKKLNEE